MTGSSTKQASAEPQIKGLPLSRLAGVHAGLAERQPIDSVLATEGVSPEVWRRAEPSWLDRIADDAGEEGLLVAAYDEHLQRARARYGREVAPADRELRVWLDLVRHLSAKEEPLAFMAEIGVSPGDLFRLQDRWARALAQSSALQAQAQAILAEPPAPLPVLVVGPTVPEPPPPLGETVDLPISADDDDDDDDEDESDDDDDTDAWDDEDAGEGGVAARGRAGAPPEAPSLLVALDAWSELPAGDVAPPRAGPGATPAPAPPQRALPSYARAAAEARLSPTPTPAAPPITTGIPPRVTASPGGLGETGYLSPEVVAQASRSLPFAKAPSPPAASAAPSAPPRPAPRAPQPAEDGGTLEPQASPLRPKPALPFGAKPPKASHATQGLPAMTGVLPEGAVPPNARAALPFPAKPAGAEPPRPDSGAAPRPPSGGPAPSSPRGPASPPPLYAAVRASPPITSAPAAPADPERTVEAQPSPIKRALPFEKKPLKERGTMAIPAMPLPTAAMPFARAPGAAPPPPSPGEPAPPPVPPLTLEQHANLCAELAASRGNVDPIFAKYGLTDLRQRLTADLAWQDRLRGNPAENQQWQRLYQHYYAFWTAQSRPGQ